MTTASLAHSRTPDPLPASVGLFGRLSDQAPDALLALIGLFRDDPRVGKIDLGVGVYRDESGATPILGCVKRAEVILLDEQVTKSYLGPEGDRRFVELLTPIVFGPAPDTSRLVGVQTPGGTGALRLAAELLAKTGCAPRVWLGRPTWPNHDAILAAAGLEVRSYDAFDPASQSLRFDNLVAALERASRGDVVLLHGCCHNPTGADLDDAQWRTVAALCAERGLLPLVDLAYQGLGVDLEADAAGLRLLSAHVPEALVAYSCDKNFGLYRERTGALFALAENAGAARIVNANLLALARANWSMPPDHGAAVVRLILDSPALSSAWRDELAAMRGRIAALRAALGASHPRLKALAAGRGMFAMLPLGPGAIAQLREEHGIYMAGNGRINIAGVPMSRIAALAAALAPHLGDAE